ncbi:MAG TPA: hypothetical protein VE422_41070 [Terriglobia bacterium]|nr:hypothetical protein [Terriglobia bacterium]
MCAREIIEQFFFIAAPVPGMIWLGVALAWGKIVMLRHPRYFGT